MWLLVSGLGTMITLSLLSSEGKLLREREWVLSKDLGDRFVSELDSLFSSDERQLFHLDGVVAWVGPGSYTSLRIILSSMNTIGFVTSCSLYSVTLHDLEVFSLLNRHSLGLHTFHVRIDYQSTAGIVSRSFHVKGGYEGDYPSIDLIADFSYEGALSYDLFYGKGSGWVQFEGAMGGMIFEDVMTREKSPDRLGVFMRFTQAVLIDKTIIYSHFIPQSRFLPLYFGLPLVTTRKTHKSFFGDRLVDGI